MDEIAEVTSEDAVPEVLRGLNAKQSKFCQFVALYDNILKAGKLAGYAVDNHSHSVLYQMVGQDRFVLAIDYWKTVYSAHASSSPEQILRKLSVLANVKVHEFYDNQWNALPKDKLPDELLECITGVKVVETKGSKRVELQFSQQFALEQLAKIHRLYGDNAERGQGMSLNITLGSQVHNSAGNQDANASAIGHLRLSFTDEKTS